MVENGLKFHNPGYKLTMSKRPGWDYVQGETLDEERIRLDRLWTVIEKGLLPNLDYVIRASENKVASKEFRQIIVKKQREIELRLDVLYEDVQ